MSDIYVYKFIELNTGDTFAIKDGTRIHAAMYRKVAAKRVPPTNADCMPMDIEGTEARGHVQSCFIPEDTEVIKAR